MLTSNGVEYIVFRKPFWDYSNKNVKNPGQAYCGGRVMRKTGLLFFSLLEIPGKRILLYIFKPLSSNLTKEDYLPDSKQDIQKCTLFSKIP